MPAMLNAKYRYFNLENKGFSYCNKPMIQVQRIYKPGMNLRLIKISILFAKFSKLRQ